MSKLLYIYKYISISNELLQLLEEKKNKNNLEKYLYSFPEENNMKKEMKKFTDWMSGRIYFQSIIDLEKHCNDYTESYWWFDKSSVNYVLSSIPNPVHSAPEEGIKKIELNHGYFSWPLSHFAQESRIKAGIACFSYTWDNPLMWAHYGNAFHGICLRYKVSNDIHSYKSDSHYTKLTFNNSNEEIAFNMVFAQVNYRSKPKVIRINDLKDPDRLILDLLFSKSDHWEYEKELRIVLFGHTGNILTPQLSTNDNKSPIELDSLILGMKLNDIQRKIVSELWNSIHSNKKIQFIDPIAGTYNYKLKDLLSA